MPKDRSKHTTASGRPPEDPGAPGAPSPIDPATGQHGDYWVLSEEERAKGFVRPYRVQYRHVGPPAPEHELRDLTVEEQERHQRRGYVSFEAYPESDSPVRGRFWTQEALDRKCCETVTTMAGSIAETYARDPGFYGSTFCVECRQHFPITEFIWAGTGERVGS